MLTAEPSHRLLHNSQLQSCVEEISPRLVARCGRLRLAPPGLRPPLVSDQATSHREQPRSRSAVRQGEGLRMSPGSNEGLLDHVLGSMKVPCAPQRSCHHGAAMLPNQPIQHLLVGAGRRLWTDLALLRRSLSFVPPSVERRHSSIDQC